MTQGIAGGEGVVEELAPVEDPRGPGSPNEIVAADFLPQPFDFPALRKEAVAADVKAEFLEPNGSGEAPDVSCVLFEHEREHPVPRQFVGRGEPGGAATDDHNGILRGRHDDAG